jgi:hypothetical protein
VDINLVNNQIAKTPSQSASSIYYILAGINRSATIASMVRAASSSLAWLTRRPKLQV